MHLSKLITVLKALDVSTLKNFKDYVHSPYFKVPKASIELFDYLEKAYPDFRENKIQPEAIAAKTTTLPNAGKQAKAGTELHKAFENFITVEDCQSNKKNQTLHHLNGLQKLHLFEHFGKEYEQAQNDLNNCEEQDVETFFYRHQYTEILFSGFESRLGRNRQNDIAPLVKTLDEYYAIKKLWYLCEALNRKQVLGIDHTGHHVQMLLETLQPYNNEQHPFIHLFINVFRMLSATTYEDSVFAYLTIKQVAIKYDKPKLSAAVSDSVNYALNSCLYWSSQGVEEAGREYLWWIEYKMKWDLLLENGKIAPITFRNIVSSATLYSNRPEWIQQFIKSYSNNLPDEDRDTNAAFALGLYFYAMKDHSTAIRYFLNAQAKEDIIFNAIIRRWQWMATYEANPSETDLLMNQLLAFEKYMQRNKEHFHHYKAPFMFFIAYSKKLIAANSKKEQLLVIDTLHAETHFPGKSWLVQQLTIATQKDRLGAARSFARV